MHTGKAFDQIMGHSPAIINLRRDIVEAARLKDIALIVGERGSGKRLVAKAIHELGRSGHPYVRVNCGAIPKDLVESELFGHERGAFTGATYVRQGKFELAHEGTLVLDDIHLMPVAEQAKLLHVTDDDPDPITRVGGTKPMNLDVRVVAMTNENLLALAAEGKFLPDLYDRLDVVRIEVPALRDRREDIPLLLEHYLMIAAAKCAYVVPKPNGQALKKIIDYPWPGNIRQLTGFAMNTVLLAKKSDEFEINEGHVEKLLNKKEPSGPGQTAVPITSRETRIGVDPEGLITVIVDPRVLDCLEANESDFTDFVRLNVLRVAEREIIRLALERFEWNRTKAAAFMKISYKALLYKMQDCGFTPKIVSDKSKDQA